jgi:hypothetical protein
MHTHAPLTHIHTAPTAAPQIIEADDTIWDQNAFNDLIRKGQVIQDADPDHYFLGDGGSLTVRRGWQVYAFRPKGPNQPSSNTPNPP